MHISVAVVIPVEAFNLNASPRISRLPVHKNEGVRFPILNLSAHRVRTSSDSDDSNTVDTHEEIDLHNRDIGLSVNHNYNDEIAYTQQTPHAGRHFLPLHPYYQKQYQYQYQQKRQPKKLFRHYFNFFNIIPKSIRNASSSQSSHSIKKQRFMEGWYYRLTLPQHNTSIAFMYSIEIEDQNNEKNKKHVPSMTAIQIMGPNDTYLVQADMDISKFWAYEHCQAFGCIFNDNNTDVNNNHNSVASDTPAKDTESFLSQINYGYQVLPTNMQGRILGHDGSFGGVMDNQGIYGQCEFKMDIIPYSGWGDDHNVDHNNEEERKKIVWFRKLLFRQRRKNITKTITQQRPKSLSKLQKSTAGWLASYSIFEPHWQITLADARATGYVNWNGTLYEFKNAPFYIEKNWGSSFPTKWYWIQCNSFSFNHHDDENINDQNKNQTRLSLTAGGGIRTLSFLGGKVKKTENLGMVGIHYNGTFYENVPWTGDMEWDIDTWGRWNFKGRCTSGKRLFEVEVNATCDLDSGVMLRVPTKEYGLEYMCRDTFEGTVSLSLFELEYCRKSKDYVRRRDVPPIIDNAVSHNCAVEVGGPWNERWKSSSNMNKLLKFLVKIPYLIQW